MKVKGKRRPTCRTRMRRKTKEKETCEVRHVQRKTKKRNEYPKRPTVATHPFETTLDF
jgi:hypothetical protein